MLTMHLEQVEPLTDPDQLALHVAMLTGTVRHLLRRIEDLESGKDGQR
jgi:hypothetical protein